MQETNAEELKNKLDGLKKAEKMRLKKIESLEKEITRIQEQIDNPPVLESTDEINGEIVRWMSYGRITF